MWDMAQQLPDRRPGTARPGRDGDGQLSRHGGCAHHHPAVRQPRHPHRRETPWDTTASIRWHFTDTGETYRMELSNGVLSHHPTTREHPADLVVTLTKPQLLAMLAGAATDGVQLDGDPKTFATIADLTDQPDPSFAIVTP